MSIKVLFFTGLSLVLSEKGSFNVEVDGTVKPDGTFTEQIKGGEFGNVGDIVKAILNSQQISPLYITAQTHMDSQIHIQNGLPKTAKKQQTIAKKKKQLERLIAQNKKLNAKIMAQDKAIAQLTEKHDKLEETENLDPGYFKNREKLRNEAKDLDAALVQAYDYVKDFHEQFEADEHQQLISQHIIDAKQHSLTQLHNDLLIKQEKNGKLHDQFIEQQKKLAKLLMEIQDIEPHLKNVHTAILEQENNKNPHLTQNMQSEHIHTQTAQSEAPADDIQDERYTGNEYSQGAQTQNNAESQKTDAYE